MRNRYGLLEESGFGVAVPYPTLARFAFGRGQLGNARHAADVPTVLAGQMSALAAFLVGRNSPAPMSEGAMESLEGFLGSTLVKFHLRKIGAVGNLRANRAGNYVLDAADFAYWMPPQPSTAEVPPLLSTRSVYNLGRLTLPGMPLSYLSEGK